MTALRRFLSRFASFGSLNRDARLFLLAITINGVIVSVSSLFFNFLILARGFDKDYLGLVNSLPSAAVLIFAIPLGMWAEKWGRKWAMVAGISILTVSYAVMVSSTSREVILVSSFLTGLAAPLFNYAQAPYMMDVSDHRNRAFLFSLSFGVVSLAGMVGNLVAGQLPNAFARLFHVAADSALAYQAVLVLSALLGGLALIPLCLLRERSIPAHPGGKLSLRQLRPIFSQPVVLKLFLPNLLLGTGAALIIPYWNVFFSEHYGFTDQNLGLLFSIFSGVSFVATLVGPALIHPFKTKVRTAVITGMSSLGFMLLAGFATSGWLGAIGYLMRGSLLSISMPLLTAFSLEQVPPHQQGMVNTLLSLGWQFSWVFAPYLSGVIQTSFGFGPLFIAASILYGLSFASVWVFFRGRQDQIGVVGAPVAAEEEG